MKYKRSISFILLGSIVVAISLVFCSFWRQNNISDKKNTINDYSDYSLFLNTDGGFRNVGEYFGDGEIYTTYYIFKIYDYINKKDDNFSEYLSYYEINKTKYLFDPNSPDNLTDIYYFVLLASENNYSVTCTEEISQYIYSLQLKDGSFCSSKKEKEDTKYSTIEYQSSNIFNTYMAIEILTVLEEEIPNEKLIVQWTNNWLANFQDEIKGRSQENYIILLDILDQLGVNSNIYLEEFLQITNDFNELFYSLLDAKKATMIDIYNYCYRFNSVEKIAGDDLKSIISYLNFCVDESTGGYNMYAQYGLASSDVLSTYYALKILDSTGENINESQIKNIYNWCSLFKGRHGGYVFVSNLPSDLKSTYYGVKLFTMKNIDIKGNIKDYLSTITDTSDELIPESLFYLTQLKQYVATSASVNSEIDISYAEDIIKSTNPAFTLSMTPYLYELYNGNDKIQKLLNENLLVVEKSLLSVPSEYSLEYKLELCEAKLILDQSLTSEEVKLLQDLFLVLNSDSDYSNRNLIYAYRILTILDKVDGITGNIREECTYILENSKDITSNLFRTGTGEYSYLSTESTFAATCIEDIL